MDWNWSWMDFFWWTTVVIGTLGGLVGFQACLIRFKTGLWPWER